MNYFIWVMQSVAPGLGFCVQKSEIGHVTIYKILVIHSTDKIREIEEFIRKNPYTDPVFVVGRVGLKKLPGYMGKAKNCPAQSPVYNPKFTDLQVKIMTLKLIGLLSSFITVDDDKVKEWVIKMIEGV